MAWQRLGQVEGECLQIFVKNNMQWAGKAHSAEHIKLFTEERARRTTAAVFGHTGYLINLAAGAGPNRDKSIESLIQEIGFANALDLPFLVMHPGAHLGAGEDAGIQQIVAGLDEVFRATKKMKVRIALENTAGQGSCLGNRLGHLAAIYDGVERPERLAVCIDTAHLFAAGYDIRTRKGWNGAMKEIESTIGLKQITAFHLNDSKTELGSRVDRHEHIGKGKIGLEAFRYLVNDARFQHSPGCIETFKSDDLHEDVENLRVLKGLRKH